MNDKTLEELRYYFTGYGSPYDETILKTIEQNKHFKQENETLSAANNDLKKEILILKNKLEVRHEGD